MLVAREGAILEPQQIIMEALRREWKLAVERTHDMAAGVAFIVPVVIDDTRDAEAKVPAEFKAVQWTRLPGGEAPAAFVARVRKLLGGQSGTGILLGQAIVNLLDNALKHGASPIDVSVETPAGELPVEQLTEARAAACTHGRGVGVR